MKKHLLLVLAFCMAAIPACSQSPSSGFITRVSIAYVSDTTLEPSRDTCLVQLSFLQGYKFFDCSGTKLSIAIHDIAQGDVECIPGTGIFSFGCSPVTSRTVVDYRLLRSGKAIRTGSFFIFPRRVLK